MDEIDASRTSWMLSQDEDPWSEKSEPVESPPVDTCTKIPGPGSILSHSLVSSSYGDYGFPSLQSSLTASIDSGHPSSLQTSAVSLDSSFSSFNRSSSFSLSFHEKRTTELSTSTVVSPDEGYDDLDSGQSSAVDTLEDTEYEKTLLTSCVACSKQSYIDSTDNLEFVSGSHEYIKHHNQPVSTVSQFHIWKPSQLAALLKHGLEKVIFSTFILLDQVQSCINTLLHYY